MQFTAVLTDRAQVYLLFYKPTRSDPLLNRIVASIDGPFSHVEIAFPERFGEEPWEKEVWGSSIYQGEPVFFRPKTYMRDGYASIAIEMTMGQMLRMKAFCRWQAEAQVGFDVRAMYLAYLPWQLMQSEGTFCSKHVVSALQFAGLPDIMHLNPALCTPSSLYKTMLLYRKETPIVQVVPGKLDPAAWSAKLLESLVRDEQAAAEAKCIVGRRLGG